MAELLFLNTNSIDMPSIEISSGQVLYCADIARTYYDTTEKKRVEINKVVYSYGEENRLSIPVDRLDREYLYVVTSRGYFYRWSLSTDWYRVYETSDLYDIIDTVETLVPSTIKQFGTKIAPKTVATQVFTKTGERVQDVLDDITRIGKTYRYLTITESNQISIPLPLPFKNYIELGNYVDIYINDSWISPKYYSIISDTSTPTSTSNIVFDDSHVLKKDDEITFAYTYNIQREKDTVYDGINGNYIVDGTIPLRKLDKYSDNYLLDDSTSAATSAALSHLYTSVNDKMNIIAGNLIAHAISYNTGYELMTDIENFTLVDNSTIYLKLHEDIITGATLRVNGSLPIPIYLNYKECIRKGLVKGDVLSLTYSKMYNKFFVNSSIAYKLLHYRQVYECVGGDSTIAIDIADFLPGYDNLHITHNNLKLIEGINYTIDGHNLLLKYSCKAGDVIEIEMDKVSGNGLPVDGNTIMKEITFTEQVIFKGPTRFDNYIGLPNGGHLDENGDLYINGDINATGKVSGYQLEATAPTGVPPLLIESTTMSPNLNADMVDDYHAIDLAIPDKTIQYIIDGESDIMNPSIQLALKSFLSRVDAIMDRMVITTALDRIEPTKSSYEKILGPGYEWSKDEPLSNENVRDTIENIIYEMDKINFMILSTTDLEELDINVDAINEMNGDEYIKEDYSTPDQYSLLNTWVSMANYINDNLFDIEKRIVRCHNINTEDSEVYDEYKAIIGADYGDIIDDSISDTDNDNTDNSQATAFRAMYLRTNGKRFYPITHRNAIVGLPFGELATVKAVNNVADRMDEMNNRITYLESIIETLLNGGGSSGSIGSLITVSGNRIEV